MNNFLFEKAYKIEIIIDLMGGNQSEPENLPKTLYEIEVETIKGEKTTMGEYKGKVLLIVNIAGKCGFTYQLKNLEEVYLKYKERGFEILGFPTNDFLHQEPRPNDQIEEFCSRTYNVTFPLFAKLVCKGKDQHPLYQYLTCKSTNPKFSGAISWNFNKFLISKDGLIINRFDTKTKPDDENVTKAIEEALAAEPAPEEAKTEEAKTEEAPAEEAKTEEAPAEEVKTEEAPAEEAKTEEQPAE